MSDLRAIFPRPCDEKWESMTPVGCHRTCAKCDKVIHDLSQYEASEIEALLHADPGICVRARVDSLGTVATKRARKGRIRRLLVAVGSSATLLAGQPVVAAEAELRGSIAGKIVTFGFETAVVARDAAGGAFHSKVSNRGRFKIKNIPPGTYKLEFIPDCGESWFVENVIVGGVETIVPDSPYEGGCILIGKLDIEELNAHRSEPEPNLG